MYPGQAIGLILIAALPIMALAGAFDPDRTTLEGRSASINATLEYPERVPFSSLAHMRLKVTNLSNRLLDTVLVEFDTAYLARFTQINILPQPQRVFAVALTDLKPQEKREVLVEMDGDEVGNAAGLVHIKSGIESLQLKLSTTIYW
jgi:hypothetical protein